MAGRGRRLRRLRPRARLVRLPPGGRTSFCSRRSSHTLAAAACSTSRCRTGRATRATAWGSAPATFPPRSAERRCTSLTAASFSCRRGSDAALARMVAHRARGPVGRVLRRRDARHAAAGAALRDVRAARARHPRARHQRGARESIGASEGRSRRRRSRSSARGSCSRPSSTCEGMVRAITDILWTGSRRVRAGAAATCAPSTTACWPLPRVGHHRAASGAADRSAAARANIAGLVFIVASLHLLYVNTRLLPPARASRRVGGGPRSWRWRSSTGFSWRFARQRLVTRKTRKTRNTRKARPFGRRSSANRGTAPCIPCRPCPFEFRL